MRTTRTRRLSMLVWGATFVLVAACGQAPGTPSPTAPASATTSATAPAASVSASLAPSGGLAWTVADVAQPSAVTEAPSVAPGQFCSPCHPAAASQLFAVAAAPGRLLAVGVQEPPAVAIAFGSSDGAHWDPLAGFMPAEGTTALAATFETGRVVIVGRDAAGAAAWTLAGDGRGTAATGGALAGPAGATAMTAVTSADGGLVAGGYADDPLHRASAAAIWASTDGSDWRRQRSDAFTGGRIWGLAAGGGTIVAVGTAGDPTRGPTGAWVRRGQDWRRARIDGDAGGVMRSVVRTEDGFVAVGYDDAGPAVWQSADGDRWARAPGEQPVVPTAGPVRMLSVAGDAAGLVATGWQSDAANGSAVSWTSTDGARWERTGWLPSFSGGQMAGAAIAGGSFVAVGRTGYPDNNQATVWTVARP